MTAAPALPAPEGAEKAAAGRLVALDGIRAFAIFMIIGRHTLAYAGPESPGFTALLNVLGQGSAPAFYFADGFLLAWRARAGKEPPGIGRSALRLLLPWAAFTVLYGLTRWPYEWFEPSVEHLVIGRTPSQWFGEALLNEFSAQLYFYPALFLVRLGSPLWVRLARARPARAWLIFLPLALLAEPVLGVYRTWIPLPGFDPVLHALRGMVYVVLGIATAGVAPRLARAGLLPAALAAVALAAARLIPELRLLSPYAGLAVLFLVFWCSGFSSPLLSGIGRRTMGISMLHMPLAMKACAAAAGLLLGSMESARVVFIWTGSFAAAFAATLILERFALGRVLLGETARGRSSAGAVRSGSAGSPQAA